MKTLLLLPLLMVLTSACGGDVTATPTAMPDGSVNGEAIYNTNCALCHGRKGDLQMSGAKDLTISILNKQEMIAVVTNGRNAMAPYKAILSAKEIEAVVKHVRTLHIPK